MNPAINVIEDEEPIAHTRFGRITVSTGLINRFRPELVQAILAHEEAHVKLRHGRESAMLIGTVVLALCVVPLGALLARVSPLCAVLTIIVGGMLYWEARCAVVRHNHDCEFEADQYAVAHGFGQGLLEVLQMTRPYDEPCNTHPAASERVRRIMRSLYGGEST